jgi:tripartite-type tricarboxylate transporter receptor subunit TctC
MGERLGQRIVVENRASAGGKVAIRSVNVAPTDGYTLLSAPNTAVIQRAHYRDQRCDVERDFAGVGPMTRAPVLLLDGPDSPHKTLVDFLACARVNPGKEIYDSAGGGTSTHLGAPALAQCATVNLVQMSCKGDPAA